MGLLAGLGLAGAVVLDGRIIRDDPAELISAARDFRARGEVRSAIIALKNALTQNPENMEARWLIGLSYLDLGDGASAGKELEHARHLGKQGEELRRALLRSMLLEGKYREVIGQVTALDAPSVSLRAIRAEALLALGELESATAAFREVLVLIPDHPDARRGLAQAALRLGDNEEARRQLESLSGTADDELPSWLLRGELELATGHYVDAERAFKRALEASEQNLAGKVGVTRALLAQRRTDDALAQIEALQPRGIPVANYLRAVAERQKGNVDEAAEALREVLRVAPNHANSLLLLGSISYERQALEQADELLTRYLALVPTSIPATKLLAAIHLQRREPDKAIERLRPFVDDAHPDALALSLIGNAYLAKGDFSAATQYYEQAATQQPDASEIRTQLALSHLASGNSDAGMAELQSVVELDPEFSRADYLIALVHLRERRFDEALAVAERLARNNASNPVPLNLIGVALEAKGDIAGARKHFERAFALDSDYVTPALNLARMDLGKGDKEAAIARYEKVLEHHPGEYRALTGLAQIALGRGDVGAATEHLELARRLNPRALNVRRLLANHYLARADAARALEVAKEAQDLAPDEPGTLLILGRAKLVAGDAPGAAETFGSLIAEQPELAASHYFQGLALARSGDFEGARAAFGSALDREPGLIPAKASLGAVALTTEDFETASRISGELRVEHPQRAEGFILEGDILVHQRRFNEAQLAYAKALSLTPSSELVIKIASVRRAVEGIPGALETLRQWLVGHPDDVQVRAALASSYHSLGRTEAAREEYEQLLEHAPAHVLGLNNLAWLYFDEHDERALDLARRAYEASPERGEVADTYGWLLVEAGKTEQGLTLLEKARRQAPENPDISYHLAAGLARAGEADRSREILGPLLASEQEFPAREAAEALQRSLREPRTELLEVLESQ